MAFEYCKKCRKAIINGSGGYCIQCIKDMDDAVKVIKEYLEKHRGATVAEISRNTEVSKKDIVFLLRDDRLVLDSDEEGVITCDRCGKSIRSGRYCKECITSMGNMFNRVQGELRAKHEAANPQKKNKLGQDMIGKKMKISDRNNGYK